MIVLPQLLDRRWGGVSSAAPVLNNVPIKTQNGKSPPGIIVINKYSLHSTNSCVSLSLMSPLPTTIILNRTLNHSITFNPSDDSLTANLPTPFPIEKVANKPKLMLLIYFVQRDLDRKNLVRKTNAEVALEMRIVERIIWQFSNYAQALRTVKEYTEVGDKNDATTGLAPTKLDRDIPGKRSKSIRMVITKEVKDVLVGWLREILAQVIFLENRD